MASVGVARPRWQRRARAAAPDFLRDGLDAIEELPGRTVDGYTLDRLDVDEYFQRTDSTSTSDFLTDALGSTLALADASGTVQTQYTYDPYGATTTQGSGSNNSFQFTGRENDGDGLYFYRARYYDPMLARLIGQDPTGFVGGVNAYAYVYDNPANLTDLLGLMPCGKKGCFAKAVEDKAVPFVFDAAGFGAGFLPGGDAVVALAQMGVSVGSGVYSTLHNDTAGVGLSGSAFVTSAAKPIGNAVVKALAEDAAKGVAETTGRAIARDAFKAIPGVGSLVSAVGFAHDLNHAFQDYLACTGGVW